MSSDSRIGTDLAGYRIESVLGRGGMGTVYLAHHLRLDRRVALKILAPELAEDERFRSRFVRESQLAAALEHANIVPIYEAGEAEGVLFIAMRLIRGSDLGSIIEAEGPLDVQRTVALLAQVASALDEAHGKGLIHRDVKPANILVAPARGADSPEHAYLTDFGLTKRRTSDSGITKTGQFMGTVDYVAPEQIEGKPLDGRADVYSLGCVLYQCLTGEPPFPQESEVATIYAHLQEPPPKPSAKRPGLPAALDAVVGKAMAKRPEDRFGAAGELARAARSSLEPELSSSQKRRLTGARAGIIVGLGLIALAAVAGAFALTRGHAPVEDGRSPSPGVAGPFIGIVRVDASTGKVVKKIPATLSRLFGESLRGIAVGEGAVWVSDFNQAILLKINPATNRVVGVIQVNSASVVTTGGGSVWVSKAFGEGGLVRIDPRTNNAEIASSSVMADGLAFGFGSLWALNGTYLERIDPSTVTGVRIDVGGNAIAVGAGSVWILDSVLGRLDQVDPRRNEVVDSIPLNGDPIDLAAGEGAAWILDKNGALQRIDVAGRGGIETIEVGERPTSVAVGYGAVWVANSGGGTLSKIDPSGAGVEQTIRVGGHPGQLAIGEGQVWVVDAPPSGPPG